MLLSVLERELQTALLFSALFSAAVLLPCFASGVLSGLIQAITSLQDQTFSYVPKAILVGVILFFASGWMLAEMGEFWAELLSSIEQIGRAERGL